VPPGAVPAPERPDALRAALLTALTVTLGLQMLRAFLPLVVYVYGGRPGVTTIGMGLLVIGVFLTAFLVALPVRLLGAAAALRACGTGLVASRVLAQFAGPETMLWLAGLGTVAFLWALPFALAGLSRPLSERRTQAAGVLLGLGLDAALAGAFGTWDLVWQRAPAPVGLTLALVLAYAWLLWTAGAEVPERGGGPPQLTWALAALGPLLLLHLLIFQNTARLTAVTGLPLAVVLAVVLAADALAVVLAVVLAADALAIAAAWRWRAAAALLAAAAGLPVAAVAGHGTGLLALAGAAAGSMASGILLGPLLAAGRGDRGPGSLARLATTWGLGMLLLVLPAFLYYIGYDRRLPFENTVIPPALAALAALAALGALPAARAERPAPPSGWGIAPAAAALLLVPLALAPMGAPPAQGGDGWPVRIMSYNLHQGYAASGMQDLEALARTIEASGAEIVALQEVSRGWLINGSTEMLTWLARRLRMHAAWGPAADAAFGNAILSRRPIVNAGRIEVPRVGRPMRRGAVWAAVDLGGGEALIVIATHLHHVEAHGHVRELQALAVANLWHERPRTVVLGDFNATPDAPEIALLRAAGLRDAFVLAGEGPGYTFSSVQPERRIDYVFVSPDLSARDFQVLPTTASDHLGIAVTVAR
jgi:endonuclease/exonuclease/phosphatase family metal-dependent hydrolase